MQRPLDLSRALAVVDDWLQQPICVVLNPTDRHWQQLKGQALPAQVAGALVMDADLAATAAEHGAILCTHDRDFTRFVGVRVEYPLFAPPS